MDLTIVYYFIGFVLILMVVTMFLLEFSTNSKLISVSNYICDINSFDRPTNPDSLIIISENNTDVVIIRCSGKIIDGEIHSNIDKDIHIPKAEFNSLMAKFDWFGVKNG